MEATQFLPAKYTESHWCIFDVDTGEVLATETIWIEDGAENPEPGSSASLLRELAVDSNGRQRKVDVIQIEAVPTKGPLRVDLARRSLTKYSPAASADMLLPDRLNRP
jgi:hypothetical protein